MEALLSEVSRVFLLELTMVCALTLCGCYVTYTDIHFRQIPNGASWGLVAVGLIGQGVFCVWGAVELTQAGLVLLVGFAVGYVLYLYGFWAAGDAKLFWAVVLVLPPTLFSSTSLSSFNTPLWALLLNTLVLTCLVLLGLWAMLRPGWLADAKAGWDGAQGLYLGLVFGTADRAQADDCNTGWHCSNSMCAEDHHGNGLAAWDYYYVHDDDNHCTTTSRSCSCPP